MTVSAARNFDILYCLGRGGFGEVYRAVMRSPSGLATDVAIKVLRRDVNPSSQAIERLRDEGHLLARLDHPAILRVFELTILEGRVALVTEYIPGEDLEGLLHGDSAIQSRALFQVIGAIAQALDAAYNTPLSTGQALRLVHRDVKPSNIRIGHHGEVKLLDFGIARTDEVKREARTHTGQMVGSPMYMAPERYVSKTNGPEGDVFSLGATLFEGIAGERFFADMDMPQIAGVVLTKHRYQRYLDQRLARLDPRVADDGCNGVSEGVIAFLRRMLSVDPKNRPTANEVVEACERFSDDSKGPSLKAWCRTRDWADEMQELAELSNRTIAEGTLVRAMPLHLNTQAPITGPMVGPGPVAGVVTAARTSDVMVAGSAAAGGALIVGLMLLGALAVWLAFGPGLNNPIQLESEPVVSTPVVAIPLPKPVEAAPEPVAPEPAPRQPAPTPPKPRAVAPAPEVAAPAPEPQPTVVTVDGDTVVRVLGPGGVVTLPAELSTGTWTIEAAFVPGTFTANAGTIQATDEGGTARVSCSARFRRCEVK